MECDLSKGEIFVIDDDASMREKLSKTLEESGYDVISFADGASLLSYAKARTPVCIFLEVRTSDRSGFELLKKLRAENCPAPVFVTSATGAIAMAVDAVRNGAYDFIVKPFCGGRLSAGSRRRSTNIPSLQSATFPDMSSHIPGCSRSPARTRGAGADSGRRDQQGSRAAAWLECADHRRLSGQHHAQGRRPERRRTAAPRLQPGPQADLSRRPPRHSPRLPPRSRRAQALPKPQSNQFLVAASHHQG